MNMFLSRTLNRLTRVIRNFLSQRGRSKLNLKLNPIALAVIQKLQVIPRSANVLSAKINSTQIVSWRIKSVNSATNASYFLRHLNRRYWMRSLSRRRKALKIRAKVVDLNQLYKNRLEQSKKELKVWNLSTSLREPQRINSDLMTS